MRTLAALAVVAALAVARPAFAQDDRVLVVPFELEHFDARVGWLGEGIAVGLTSALGARGVPVVTRDERLLAFDRLQLPATAALTRATLIKVAELVGASKVVLGVVRERDTNVTVAPRVLDVIEATLVDATPISTPAAGLVGTFATLAAAVDKGEPAGPGSSVASPSTPAFESYIRGLLAPTPEAKERFLAQAMTLAPRFDPPRAALWEAQTSRAAHDLALRTATAASASDPAWRIRAASSLVQLRRWDEAFNRLTALGDSRDPDVSTLLGVIQLRRSVTTPAGRATYYFNQAVERDAASADACFNLGYAYWVDKDAMAAAYWLREAVRRDPTDGDAHYVLAAALTASGAGPEAERERELARRLSERWEAAGGETVPRGLERLPDSGPRTAAWLDSVLSTGAQRDRREAAAFQLDTARRAYDGGDDQGAIRALQRALYSTPYDADALHLLARAQARSGLLQEAIATYKIAIWSAESADLQVELGEALLRNHDVEGARRAAARALVLVPTHSRAQDLLRRANASPGA